MAGSSDDDLNPFVVVAKKKKKKKKKRKKAKKKRGYDSDSSISSDVEAGGLAKDETDLKMFEEKFMLRSTEQVVADASVYDRFSDNEKSDEDTGERLGPGLRKSKKKNRAEATKQKSKKKLKKSKKKKKEKKSKKKKKKKKQKSSSSSDDDSDDEEEKISMPRLDLKSAYKVLEDLLGAAESMKGELPLMLGHIDEGEELDIKGIPNEEIRKCLTAFFKAMLLEKGPEGGWKSSGNTPKLSPLFSPNIERYVFKPKPKPKVESAAKMTIDEPSKVEKVQAPVKKRRAGPAMPSVAELNEAKRLVEERLWEKKQKLPEEEESDDDDEEGPTLPGQNSAAKERALEKLRTVREMQLEQKKLADKKPKHEGWMTALPKSRRLDQKLDQRGRSFSMKGVTVRGDSSEWTMTPEEKRRRHAEKLLEMQNKKKNPGRLRIKGQEDVEKEKIPAGKQLEITKGEKGEVALIDIHRKEKMKSKKRKQIGGTTGFSFKAMREARRFNEKEANKMHTAGKKLKMSFGAGQLYQSQM